MKEIGEQRGGEMESRANALTVELEARFMAFRLNAEQRQLELLKQEWFGDRFLVECGECEAIAEAAFGSPREMSA
jgi:hypothetical protein